MSANNDPDFAHIGPGTLAGRFMRRFWHPICKSGDLAVGRPIRAQILGEYFTTGAGKGKRDRVVIDNGYCLLRS